jgi:hypothetical protein
MPHSSINKTPFEAMTGSKPDLTNLRIFGCRACAKRPGKRPFKLDNHSFNGIFLEMSTLKMKRQIKLKLIHMSSLTKHI